jgi:hypothetical protein
MSSRYQILPCVLCGLSVVTTALAQSTMPPSRPQGSAVATNSTSTRTDDKKITAPVTPVAAERVRLLAAQLEASLKQPPSELARMARDMGASVSASLEYDCELAELEQREALLEEHQEMLQKSQESERQSVEKQRAELETRQGELRKRFGVKPPTHAQELHAALARDFATRIRQHQDQVEKYEKRIEAVNRGLAIVRRRLAERTLARDLMALSGKASSRAEGVSQRDVGVDVDDEIEELAGTSATPFADEKSPRTLTPTKAP